MNINSFQTMKNIFSKVRQNLYRDGLHPWPFHELYRE